MDLLSGARLGPYEILAPLGSGGMGEVYRAHDPRLNRDIAIKILPDVAALDPERRARFEREAQSVAALNHPNIVTIYSVENADDTLFLTMELVEGRSLAETLPKGGVPLDRLLKIAMAVADAMAAAHQKGITHRDLKPANIMLGEGAHEGRVKVLDFGLAKLTDIAPLGSATAIPTALATGEGRILGTVAYMSPEQAEGKAIDARSDLFSLGVILYEMATGRRPFTGDTSISIISSIVKDTPKSVTEINAALPRELGRIVRRALVKDPERRYQTAKDLRNELEELKRDLDSGEVIAARAEHSAAVSTARRSRWALASGAVAAVVLVILGAWLLRGQVAGPGGAPSEPQAPRVDATFTRLTAQAGVEQFPSLSPDGKWVVYSAGATGTAHIFLHAVGAQSSIDLTKDSTDDNTQPAFSPDGDRIAFRSSRDGGGIFVMGRTGDSPRRLTDEGFNPAWSPDGRELLYATETIVHPFGRNTVSQLWAVQVATGERRQISEGDGVQPAWSPHGYRIAYWAIREAGSAQRDIFTLPAGGGSPESVTNDSAVDWNPIWSPDGKFLYFSSNRGGSLNLWRVPIDERSGRTLGSPEPVTTPSPYVAHLSISAGGQQIVYASVTRTANIEKVPFNPASTSTVSLSVPVTSGSRLYSSPEISPNGEWVVFASFQEQEDLFVIRADGTGLRQLTNDLPNDRGPRWSPDSNKIAFYSNRGGSYNVWTINPDGSGLQRVTTAGGLGFAAWSPDASRLAAFDLRLGTGFIFDPRKAWQEQAPTRLPQLPSGLRMEVPRWSPDGQWLAGNDLGGGLTVFSFQSGTYQKVTDFGGGAVWLKDSRRLMFAFQGKLLVVDRESKKVHEFLSVPDGAVAGPSLTRDNSQVYFVRSTNEADIWMATLK